MVAWDWISLFNFEGTTTGAGCRDKPCLSADNRNVNSKAISWGFSSAGRAPALQAGGQRFDPANLHQRRKPQASFTACFEWERRQNEVSELWTERESETAGANGT